MAIQGISDSIMTAKSNDVQDIWEKRRLERRIIKLESMLDDVYHHMKIPNKKCNICKNDFKFWSSYGTVSYRFVSCPFCASVERQRLLWFYLNDKKLLKNITNLLHFAPEKCLHDLFIANTSIDYYPVDIDPSRPFIRHVVDIMDMPYEDGFFDLIIISHVLETVTNDMEAFAEIKRVLKPNGIALVMSVVHDNQDKTLENEDWNTKELRLKHYGNMYYMRRYGADFINRITQAGLKVQVVNHYKILSPKIQNTYGLREFDKIYRITH